MTDQLRRALDEDLCKAAQVLAVGTGESQLHAAAEHIAPALAAPSGSVLAPAAAPPCRWGEGAAVRGESGARLFRRRERRGRGGPHAPAARAVSAHPAR